MILLKENIQQIWQQLLLHDTYGTSNKREIGRDWSCSSLTECCVTLAKPWFQSSERARSKDSERSRKRERSRQRKRDRERQREYIAESELKSCLHCGCSSLA
jgi:hypothetical protein